MSTRSTTPRCGHPGARCETLRVGDFGFGFVVCEQCVDIDRAHERRRQTEALIESSGVWPRMRGWSRDTLPATVDPLAVADAAMWTERLRAGERANLYMHGPVGTGKTGVAWCIGRALIERDGMTVRFVNFRELLQDLVRNDFDRGLVDRAARAQLLILDDLGAERPSEWPRLELASLVEHRCGSRLPTIVTSNFEPAELARRLGRDDANAGKRIVSRLVEGATQVRFRGCDLRVAVRSQMQTASDEATP
jgi:DNA replication protein DnaC